MTEVAIPRALDGAQLVKVETITGIQYAQVWHGGTQVSVYCPQTGHSDTWDEVTDWNVSDEHGRPVSRTEVEKHMQMEFARITEELAEWGQEK